MIAISGMTSPKMTPTITARDVNQKDIELLAKK